MVNKLGYYEREAVEYIKEKLRNLHENEKDALDKIICKIEERRKVEESLEYFERRVEASEFEDMEEAEKQLGKEKRKFKRLEDKHPKAEMMHHYQEQSSIVDILDRLVRKLDI